MNKSSSGMFILEGAVPKVKDVKKFYQWMGGRFRSKVSPSKKSFHFLHPPA
jgi:hypothetical protein